MTNKEAAEIIKNNAVPSFPLKVDIEMWEAAKDKAIEALEKQIPKKPIEDDVGWLFWRCPRCGNFVGKNMTYKDHHCGCGQSIDWSDDNE